MSGVATSRALKNKPHRKKVRLRPREPGDLTAKFSDRPIRTNHPHRFSGRIQHTRKNQTSSTNNTQHQLTVPVAPSKHSERAQVPGQRLGRYIVSVLGVAVRVSSESRVIIKHQIASDFAGSDERQWSRNLFSDSRRTPHSTCAHPSRQMDFVRCGHMQTGVHTTTATPDTDHSRQKCPLKGTPGRIHRYSENGE